MMSSRIRVAIVGSGPAGFYAIEHLLNERSLGVEIDLYERLPAPWGLVRYGVAPDHPEKKRVIDRTFKYYLAHPAVRFIGNLEVGTDISHADLSAWYHAVIYAVGATEDKRLGIPGEHLPGVCAARDFVAWYNGHPDSSHLKFDLSGERAVVVGNGNVALDVARILAMPPEDLAKTDIADYALQALRKSRIREVVILGRSQCLKAAFHSAELEKLGQLHGVDVVVDQDQLPESLGLGSDIQCWKIARKVRILAHLANRGPSAAHKKIVFRFLTVPTRLIGSDRLERVVVSRNQFPANGHGSSGDTSSEYELEAGVLFRAIGYRSVPLQGLPFDERRGVVENVDGRVSHSGNIVPGTYVTGWIKNGPRGIIGTNKQCAHETVTHLLDDAKSGRLSSPAITGDQVLAEIRKRKAAIVDFSQWLNIDRAEVAAGANLGRPRLKLTTLGDMLTAS